MSAHKSDAEMIAKTHNVARYFVENPQISAILLLLVMAWGVWGVMSMPQRKDPYLAVRVAMVLCPWPGVNAERVEQLVTRKIEQKVAENKHIKHITSTSRSGLSVVAVELTEEIDETGEIFDDIDLKLKGVLDLPEGAGPIIFMKDFGDTAALMLTVASPKVGDVEAELRAREVSRVIGDLRAQAASANDRASLVFAFSCPVDNAKILREASMLARRMESAGTLRDAKVYAGPSLAIVDGATSESDARLIEGVYEYAFKQGHISELNPDLWEPAVVRSPDQAAARLKQAAGDKYTFRQLENYTDKLVRRLQQLPIVSKVSRWGVQQEAVYLEYSQERLASYGLDPGRIKQILGARNIIMSGGNLDFAGKNFLIDPSGAYASERELGGTIISSTTTGTSAYLRDLVDMERSYRSPPENLNYLSMIDKDGQTRRARAITLAVNMREGQQIHEFSEEVNNALAEATASLPEDLIMVRTSDQPRQVEESVELFMEALGDAVFLVILVSLIGFWEWRSALLMALSIPITLAMTFGMMHLMGLDLQQVSIASLILALGLLVDDPVVANDAIKRDLELGHSRSIAAWLGPTKLAKAILYATVTNCIAYLPFLMLKGDTGRYLFAMPVVITASLIASRFASMSFIPFLGRYLLLPDKKAQPSAEERRTKGFSGAYFRLGSFLIRHRWKVLVLSILPVAGGFHLQSKLIPQFFPKDLSYLSYVDVWLPEDAPVWSADETARIAEGIIRKAAEDYGAEHPGEDGKPLRVLKNLTTFVGGGGPRFWFSFSPELSQPNYAQVLIEVTDKRLTQELEAPFQVALESRIPGARLDVRQLESGEPVGVPVQIRLSGDNIHALRNQADKLKDIFHKLPEAYRVRDDWGAEIFKARLAINADKANMIGVTNEDVARSSYDALNGFEATSLTEGRLSIPVIVRLRGEERARIDDVENLYVYSSVNPGVRAPLGLLSSIKYGMDNEKIARRDQHRTITVSCYPVPGRLPSEVLTAGQNELDAFRSQLPQGIRMEIGGEHEKQVKGFNDLVIVLVVSVLGIYLALLFQFKNAVKPFIVFSAIPYGAAGAFASLYVMGTPFGFMAFLGVISLVGVIVSHVIVLFDFIEEKLEEGEDLRLAILDAGILRLRPVLITVGATVIALFPLATSGGPLWEPLCYAQIGGLTAATFITLLMVPVIYAIVAFDLKLIKEDRPAAPATPKDPAAT